jgi:hypothetical protein
MSWRCISVQHGTLDRIPTTDERNADTSPTADPNATAHVAKETSHTFAGFFFSWQKFDIWVG